MDRIKVVAVSYLNTLPFITGLEQSRLINDIDLTLESPADCARLVLENKVDVGLLPVAVIPKLPYSEIITDYCIGSDGEVGSVGIFSEVPLKQTKKVILDYQSRTSVVLAKLLLKEYWKLEIDLIDGNPGYEQQIKGTTAGLVIGDRALQMKGNFPHFYDLGEAWKEYTTMPFVFACWVTNKPIPKEFVSEFNLSLKQGVENITSNLNYLTSEQLNYLQNHIQYSYSKQEQAALKHFLNNASAYF